MGASQRPQAGNAERAETAETAEPDLLRNLCDLVFQARPPIADTYVRAGVFASQNFGSAPTLLAKQSTPADYTRRSYLKFDVSHIGDTDRVTLRLHGSASSETAVKTGL